MHRKAVFLVAMSDEKSLLWLDVRLPALKHVRTLPGYKTSPLRLSPQFNKAATAVQAPNQRQDVHFAWLLPPRTFGPTCKVLLSRCLIEDSLSLSTSRKIGSTTHSQFQSNTQCSRNRSWLGWCGTGGLICDGL